MKTSNPDTAVSYILKYLLHLISIALFYGLTLYFTTSFWIHYLLNKFTRVPYVPTPNFHDQVIHLLIIYSLFCYFANNFVLNLYQNGKAKQLIISYLVDFLVLQLSMTIMIFYNNRLHTPAIDNSIYNIYLVTILLVIKEAITMWLLSRKTVAVKKN
ncbi:MAG: hypothetical protein ACHQHN_08550 [Sphingobacteriales bacterium]